MKQSFQLNIENPCHEKWESFTTTATGGFCASCQKNVIDFSQMSESQLIAFFRDRQNSSQGLCGRFREDQLKKSYHIEEWVPAWSVLNDQVQYEIPVAIIAQKKYKQAIRLPLIRPMKVVRNIAAAVLTLLCIEEGIGQDRVVSGQVIDADGKDALPGVSISIKGTTRGTVSDRDGRYEIAASDKDILIFSFVGYKLMEKKATTTKEFEKTAMEGDVMGYFTVVPVSSYVEEHKNMANGGFRTSAINLNSSQPEKAQKHTTKIAVRVNAVQNGEFILVPELVAPKDSTGNSFKWADDEKWFRENGFQHITSVQLYDYSGRVFQERFTKLNDGMISVDVQDIPQGTYIVRAVYKNERSLTENEISSVRIMIER